MAIPSNTINVTLLEITMANPDSRTSELLSTTMREYVPYGTGCLVTTPLVTLERKPRKKPINEGNRDRIKQSQIDSTNFDVRKFRMYVDDHAFNKIIFIQRRQYSHIVHLPQCGKRKDKIALVDESRPHV